MKVLLYFSFLLLVLAICDDGVELTTDNYDELVLGSKEAWLIKYYSSRCMSCKEFAPVWSEAVKKIKKLKIGQVNIDEEKGMLLAQKTAALMNGIPNVVLIYGRNGEHKNIMVGIEKIFKLKELLGAVKREVDNLLTKTEEMYHKQEL